MKRLSIQGYNEMANIALAGEAFHPHGVCYLWSPLLMWLHVASDFLIFLAYITIPIVLVYFITFGYYDKILRLIKTGLIKNTLFSPCVLVS